MTAKSPIFVIRRHLPIWVSLNYRSYTIASAALVQGPPKDDKDAPDSAEFVSAVQVLKNRLHPDRLVHVLDSTSDVTLALKVFKWASRQKRFQQTAETYAHMIFKLGMVGDHEEMEVLLNEMVNLQLQNIEQTFDYLIHAFCKNYRPVEALQVFKISNLAKHRLSVSTCNTLLDAFASQGGNFCSLMFVYKEMVKAGILPDVETLNHLIKGLCDIGCLDLALTQFHRMDKKQCFPNSQTFEILIKALYTSEQADKAVELLNQMLDLQISPHFDFYNSIIPLLCSINRFKEVIKLLRIREDAGGNLDLHLYSYLINCLSANQQIESAVELIRKITNSGLAPLTNMYMDIVDGFCNIGKFTEAMSFLDEGRVLEIEPYNTLLKGFCDISRYQEATVYLKKMAEGGLTNVLSWYILIKGLCEEGLVRKAFQVMGRMIISSSSSFVVDGTIYSAIITGYCKIGAYENALSIFRLSCLYDLSLDSESCSQLIEGLCVVKKIQESAEVFYHIIGKGDLLTSNALSELIQGICHNGKVQEAIKMRSLAVFNGSSSNSVTISTILLGLLDLNKEKDILTFLSQILVEGCALDVKTYCILIHGLCSKFMMREAAILFNQMVHESFIPNSETLELLVVRLARCSQLHLVMHSLDSLIKKCGLLSPTMCNAVIYSLMKEGHKHEARNFLDTMLDKGWVPDAETHVLLVGNNNKDGRNENDDVFKALGDDKVSKILAEGLEDFDNHMALR